MPQGRVFPQTCLSPWERWHGAAVAERVRESPLRHAAPRPASSPGGGAKGLGRRGCMPCGYVGPTVKPENVPVGRGACKTLPQHIIPCQRGGGRLAQEQRLYVAENSLLS